MGLGDWWKKLRARPAPYPPRAEAPPPDPLAPASRGATVELSPKVRAHEYQHAYATAAGPLRVRSFVTEGLAALGASEVRVTLPAAWDEAAVEAAMNVLGHLEAFASQGQPAELGGFTGFRSSGVGGGRAVGVTYARGVAVAGIPGASAALVAVLLHEQEYVLVQRGYASRVLGRLAERERFFPYPPWWILRDEPIVGEAEQAGSILERIEPYMTVGDVRVTRIDGRDLVVSLPGSAAGELRALWEEHPDLRVLVLDAFLAPDADGQMVWIPGSPDPVATAAGGAQPTRMGFAFAMLVGSGSTDAFRIVEDGAGVTLSDASFDRARDALVAGRELALPLDAGVSLRVRFRPEVLVDPITGDAARAVGGWERYAPREPRVDTGRVAVEGVVLLIPEAELAVRVDTPVLAGFIREVERAMEAAANEHPVDAPTPIAAQLTLAPERAPQVKLAFQGSATPRMLKPLHAALAAMAPVAVRGEVAFRIETTVHPHPLGN